MYFLLSKILLFLIFPIYWIFVLLLIAAFTKRKKLRKWTSISAVVLMLIFSNTWLCNLFEHIWEYPAAQLPDNAHYSAAIVLGGFSSQISATDGRFNAACERFLQAVRLQKTGKVSHIMISGGNGTLNPRQFSEAVWVQGQLKQFGVPDSAIVLETKSRNTLENARFSAEILKTSGLKPPYLLITSGYHMRRALMIFKHAGVDVVPYPCNFSTSNISRPSWLEMVPDMEAITWWNGTIKEEWGYMVNYFMKPAN
ncbi:YdcF family protein [Mucilaginibacter mali]|uniref:YdcF family protein n=1 Tax=Mucilaginibacter mali TaxID=2740462 RepID=A0A7D4QKC9_9SPHI|nr:YdcF family protein [Mucilaginibacter mali]QKJ30390.1 YdcF family protein [Mucilaginibacter mali]